MGKELDFDKLKGGVNFHTWKFAVENFLALKGLGGCLIHRSDKAATSTAAAVEYAERVAKEGDEIKLRSARPIWF